MKIEIFQLITGSKKAEGVTVIIDVFRAFSTSCYIINNGAEKIITVGEVEEAYKLKKNNPDIILVGERNCKKLPGFDYGNSPTEIEHANFRGKTVVLTTSAGTQGIVNAVNADEIITGSFVNVKAIINYLRNKNPEKVSLVAMGKAGVEPADEDINCAHYIKNALENRENNFSEIVDILKKGDGKRFFDRDQPESPENDFQLCVDINRFNFILKAEREDGLISLRKG